MSETLMTTKNHTKLADQGFSPLHRPFQLMRRWWNDVCCSLIWDSNPIARNLLVLLNPSPGGPSSARFGCVLYLTHPVHFLQSLLMSWGQERHTKWWGPELRITEWVTANAFEGYQILIVNKPYSPINYRNMRAYLLNSVTEGDVLL